LFLDLDRERTERSVLERERTLRSGLERDRTERSGLERERTERLERERTGDRLRPRGGDPTLRLSLSRLLSRQSLEVRRGGVRSRLLTGDRLHLCRD